jgi:hypothetical protein
VGFLFVALALDRGTPVSEARAAFRDSQSNNNEANVRIAAFYEELIERYPLVGSDSSSFASPWDSAPFDFGARHLTVRLRVVPSSVHALAYIRQLAERHNLTIYNPMKDEVVD